MDLVTGMRVFHAVVDSGSFTSASQRLDISPAMVTRYVAQLEAHLGARLMPPDHAQALADRHRRRLLPAQRADPRPDRGGRAACRTGSCRAARATARHH